MNEECYVEPQYRDVTAAELEQAEMVVLHIQGMGCPHCATRVRNSLIALYGVADAVVDHTTNQAPGNV
jgi:hypothetical protein